MRGPRRNTHPVVAGGLLDSDTAPPQQRPTSVPPERWHRLTAIFHAASARDPDTRDAFLADACADDASLASRTSSRTSDGSCGCSTKPPRESAHQLPIPDPVRLVGIRAEPAFLVDLVVLEVAFEPFHVAVALEREHVRRD